MKILLKIAYMGTAYCGYQVQPNGVTIQEKLNEATASLFGFPCDIVGCSRTDSGVHARGFCAAVTAKGTDSLPTTIPVDRIPRALNVRLPDDISVLSAIAVPSHFHPRYDVVSKEYEYLIYNGAERDPFLLNRAWHIPQCITEEALLLMQRAADAFVGTKDFSALRDGVADPAENTCRTVYAATVKKEGDMISFRVRADGFLYHMVRIMAGTLVDVARGRISAEALPLHIQSLDRINTGMTAPAEGLYLDRVFYQDKDLIL